MVCTIMCFRLHWHTLAGGSHIFKKSSRGNRSLEDRADEISGGWVERPSSLAGMMKVGCLLAASCVDSMTAILSPTITVGLGF